MTPVSAEPIRDALETTTVSLLAAINRVFESVVASDDDETFGAACLSVAEELTGSRISHIGAIGTDGLLHAIATSTPGRHGQSMPAGTVPIHGILAGVISVGQTVLCNRPASQPEQCELPPGHPPLHNFLGVPLTDGGTVIGMVAVGNREGGYGAAQQAALEALAPAIAQALVRRRAEARLRDNEERLRLSHAAARIGSFEWDIPANVNRWSPELETLHGLAPGGFDGTYEDWREHVHPDDLPAAEAAMRQALESDDFHTQWRIVLPDGTHRWIEARAKVFRDQAGQPLRMIGVNVDITERKLAEEALRNLNDTLEERIQVRTAQVRRQADQLRALAFALTTSEQRERKRLASILHDHVQQLLVAATFRIKTLNATGAETDSLTAILREALEACRSLQVELTPPMLHEHGLVAALEWLVARFSRQHGIQVNLTAEPDAEPPSEQARHLVFECVRELLLNIAKHAATDNAEVRLQRPDEDRLTVTVRDHGRGFDPETFDQQKSHLLHFGLLNIRERVAHLGGHTTIRSVPGDGTCVTIDLPLAPPTTPPTTGNPAP